MLQAQAAYGSLRAQLDDDDLSLGRNLFASVPEDVYDRGPLHRSTYRLVADVRLDNRPELAARLGIGSTDHGRLSDAALLFEALLKWGDDAPIHCFGEFAFAFWDGARRHLLLGRDILGVRPLYFYRSNSVFAFTSMPSGLHALAEVPYDFDKQFMVESLGPFPPVGQRTCFKDVQRVEPAHLVRVTRNGIRSHRYWRPSITPRAAVRPQEHEEGLRAVMDQAVTAQLRGAGDRVATHLSGGLDSSTVTATAARLLPAGKVVAFTAIPRAGFNGPTPTGTIANEAELAAATARLYPNIEHVLVEYSGESPLERLDRNFLYLQQPAANLGNAVWGQAIHRAAQAKGLNVILKGYAGNMTISYSGLDVLPMLLARGHLLKLARHAFHLARNGLPLASLGARTAGPFLPGPIWQALRRLPGRAAEPWRSPTDRRRQDPYQIRLASFSRGDGGNSNKAVLAEWGLSVRDPTGDKRVIEYCLATPVEEFIRGGVPRSLARRAFADRLPKEVATWRLRGYQSADWYETLARIRPEIEREVALIAQCDGAVDVIDVAWLKDTLNSWPDGGWHEDAVRRRYRTGLLQGIAAGHFMRKVRGGAN